MLNGAQVGSNCLIGAGALVPQHAVIPDGSLAFGSPAKVRSALDEAAIAERTRRRWTTSRRPWSARPNRRNKKSARDAG